METGPVDELNEGGGLGREQLRRDIGSAVRWSVLNSFFSRFSQVAVGIVLARLIAPKEFGVYAAALVVLNIVMSVSELGVSVALVRTPGNVSSLAPTVTTLSILSGLLLALICIIGAPWFAAALNAPKAAGLIRVMALLLVIAGVSAVPAALLQRSFRQDHRLVADLISFTISTSVAVGLAVAGAGAWSLAWSRVAGNASGAAAMFALTKERYRPGFNRAEAVALLNFGLPLAGASLLVFAVLNVDYIIVGSILGPLALGLYLLAFNLSSWPVGAFSLPVRSVSLPAFARLQGNPEEVARSFGRALRMMALFTVPACVLLASLGQPLVRFVYGPRWGAAAGPLALLVVLGGARVMFELAYDCLASSARSRAILGIQCLWLLALVPALAVGAHLGGIRGVAISHVVVVLVLVLPAYLIALRAEGVRPVALAKSVARPLFAGAIMAAVALMAQRLVATDASKLLIGGIASTSVYAVIVFPLRHEALSILRKAHA